MPDIIRKQLDINFDFLSNYSNDGHFYSNGNSRLESANINGNISSSFSRYVNTRKKISNFRGHLSFRENYISRNNKQSSTDNNSTTIDNESKLSQQNSLYLDWSNKWYFSKLFFLNYDFSGSISYIFSQDKTKNQAENFNQKRKDFSFQISTRLGVGYGRIESVRDACQALYIANALSKKGVLSRSLSDDELFELSQLISTVTNKRFLDARLHLTEEITTLDSFFEENDLLEENGVAYFTTLYDMWQYGNLFSRNSGYEISFIVRPYYSHRNLRYSPVIRDIIYNSNQHLIGLSYSYEKPYKLKWQHSLSTGVSGGIISFSEQNRPTENDYKNKTTFNSFSAIAMYSFGYYPNTRTNIRITTRQEISKNVYIDEGHSTYFHSILSANVYYYFSPNLRLAGDCNLIFSPSRPKENDFDYSHINTFSSSFNLHLSYSIF
ncbi:MAG: hypothetical protein LBC84_05635 [Prevotellaceae bacterium]|nr:hypothetical protein [Prevotellaceae bacterium]